MAYVRCVGSYEFSSDNVCPYCERELKPTKSGLIRAHPAGRPQAADFWDTEVQARRSLEDSRKAAELISGLIFNTPYRSEPLKPERRSRKIIPFKAPSLRGEDVLHEP